MAFRGVRSTHVDISRVVQGMRDKRLKIATFNVNDITARLPNLLRWLGETMPDVACLQELKILHEKFPEAAIRLIRLARRAGGNPPAALPIRPLSLSPVGSDHPVYPLVVETFSARSSIWNGKA